MTANSHTKVDWVCERQRNGAELLPGEAVIASEPGELAGGASQAQPHIRVINSQIPAGSGTGSGTGSGFEERPVQARGCQDGGKPTRAGQIFSSHNACLGKRIRLGE